MRKNSRRSFYQHFFLQLIFFSLFLKMCSPLELGGFRKQEWANQNIKMAS